MPTSFDKDTAQDWRERIVKELKGAPFDTVLSQTADDIAIQPFYVPEERKAVLASGPESPWTIHQDFSGLQEKNGLILQALEAGIDSIALSAENLSADLKDVLLDIIRLEIGGADFHVHWPEFLAAQDISDAGLKGGYLFDPYGLMLLNGQFDSASFIPEMVKLFAESTQHNKHWKTLSLEGDRYANAGASPVQELAFTLSQVKAYLDIERSLASDMNLCLSADTDYFETACKLRAFRILWANLLKAYHTEAELEIKARSTTRDLAPVDQHGNLLRATSQAMAAIAGGADRVELRPFDAKGDAFSLRMARNIQKLLQHESYLDKNLNPMKGAYLFEELTADMAHMAWDLFKDIESKGGWLHFVQEGYIQKLVHRSAEAYAEAVNTQERTWLGVNKYPDAAQPEWKGMEVEFDGRTLPVLKNTLA
jgi:methylmalonyl-CoA mutase